MIYRKSAVFGSGNVFTIFVNGQPVTELPNGGYFPYDAEPGNLEFNAVRNIGPMLIESAIDHETMKGKVHLQFEAQLGQIYYVNFGQGFGWITLKQIPEDKALKDLKSLRMTEDLRAVDDDPS